MNSINFHVLSAVVGITGMGKSYFTKQKLISSIAKNQPVVIFDRENEYAGKNVKDVPKNGNWKSFDNVYDFMIDAHRNDSTISGVNVISCEDTSDYDYGIKYIYEAELPVCMLLEEAHFIFGDNELKHLKEIIKNIARFGRKKSMSLILITQRFMDIHKDVRTQLRSCISFKQNDEADVESLNKFDSNASKKIVAFKPQEFEIFGELPESVKKDLK